MGLEVFANQAATTVVSGGTGAPVSGTIETWTVASSVSFPAASSTATPPTQFHVADTATGYITEIIAVTNVSGTTWTVTRGAEGTTPVAHVSGFTIQQVLTEGGLQQLSRVDWLNVVTMFGADPTGTNDSTTAIQNAINSLTNGGTVYFPSGAYKISTSLTLLSGVRLTGSGSVSAGIFSTASSIINAGSSLTDRVEIDHLYLEATGSDVFSGANISRWTVHDCILIENSAGNAIWNAATVGLMIECVFERNEEFVYGSTRTIAAWSLNSNSNSNQVNHNTWRNNVHWNKNADATQYWHQVISSGSSTQNVGNTWRGNVYENPLGGMINLKSGTRTVIEDCLAYDTTANVANNLIYLQEYTGNAQPSTDSVIIASGRASTSTTFGAGIGDIAVDVNTTQTVIIAPVKQAVINLNGATGVKLIGLSASSTVNGNTSTAAMHAAAGTSPPSPVVTAGPTNECGTVTFGTGTATTTGQLITVTFGTPMANTPVIVVTPNTGPTASLNLNVQSVSATGFSVYCGTAPSASQANTFYGFSWLAMV